MKKSNKAMMNAIKVAVFMLIVFVAQDYIHNRAEDVDWIFRICVVAVLSGVSYFAYMRKE